MKNFIEDYFAVIFAIAFGIFVVILFGKTAVTLHKVETMSEAAYEHCINMDQEDLNSYTIYLDGLRKDEKDISFAGLKLDDYTYEIDYSKKEIRINKKEKRESSSHPVIMPISHY